MLEKLKPMILRGSQQEALQEAQRESDGHLDRLRLERSLLESTLRGVVDRDGR
ncbi:hypothetical protein ACSQ76_12220 [Roseovarius sp. B08]|uniref:hypothetical protein n=1 Tax=Roseovarius sp. B08 TaxID=3449223 RepID=UPI003EDC345B